MSRFLNGVSVLNICIEHDHSYNKIHLKFFFHIILRHNLFETEYMDIYKLIKIQNLIHRI